MQKKTSIDACVVTIDIDWAPDWAIEEAARVLVENKTKATWFITHHSPAVDYLKSLPDLFEIGIHPNLLPGSTHGSTYDEVLDHMRQLAPNAVSMRTHSLYQATPFLVKAALEYGIRIDSSIFMPGVINPRPFTLNWHDCNLWRVPFIWEELDQLFRETPAYSLDHEWLIYTGIKVFCMHPIHIALNTVHKDIFRDPYQGLNPHEFTQERASAIRHHGTGPRTLFMEIAESPGVDKLTLREAIGIQDDGFMNLPE